MWQKAARFTPGLSSRTILLNIGFVYILLNPAFPRHIKIGCTARDPYRRAGELSRQTGVPDDFVVLFHELVGDAKQVEKLLHDRFAPYRMKRNKEFFQVPAQEAVRALLQLALRFPVPVSTPSLVVDLLPHFTKYFEKYLDPQVVEINLVQLPGTCYLDVTREPSTGDSPITTHEELPLGGLITPDEPTLEDLRRNELRVRSCDEYDWIMISNLFPPKVAHEIAHEWEKPMGKLDQERQRKGVARQPL